MMKTIYMTMAAVSALAFAAPLAAQSWSGGKSAPQSWNGDKSNVVQLQTQLGAGIARGTITRSEAVPLRDSLRELIRMERHFSRDGFSGQERNSLQQRSTSLHRQMERAERNANGRDRRAGRDRDDGRDFADADRRDMRGDRFAGDVRIGQRFNDRQVALPMQYRARYQDSDASYYRYDEDRIYQIDRRTGLILAMFNVGG